MHVTHVSRLPLLPLGIHIEIDPNFENIFESEI